MKRCIYIILLLLASCQVDMPMESELESATAEIKISGAYEMETRKGIESYNFPTAIMGKSVTALSEEGQEFYTYRFTEKGVYCPVSAALYSNPVTPDMFNDAIDGTTSETVGEDGDDFFYELAMTGSFLHKGNNIYGDVILTIERSGGAVTINGFQGVIR